MKKELEMLENPETNERIFKYVLAREEAFSGKYVSKFPDLILVPTSRYLVNPALSNSLVETRIDKPYLTGAHKSDQYGIFMAHGKNIKSGYILKGAKIVDLTPTILHLFGIPTPTDMDGKVLEAIFEEYFAKPSKLKEQVIKVAEDKDTSRTFTPDEEEKVKERLRKLGYF